VVGSCEHDNEPSDSSTTELVIRSVQAKRES
jgi:hypothetical protein